MAASLKRPFVVGTSHLSVPLEMRDRLYVKEDHAESFLGRLRDADVGQVLLLSTCARTEIQGAHDDPEAAAVRIKAILADHAGVDAAELAQQFYAMEDEEAIRHIFSVVSALDSPITGEPQVTGQVRDSHRLARAAGMVGPELEAVLSAAYGAAKRVRTETTVGERPVSIAAAAVNLAASVHGDLSTCTALLLGAGEMGEVAADRFVASDLGRLVVSDPVEARARLTAQRYGCHHAPFDDLPPLVADSDIVICGIGNGAYAVSSELVSGALAARKQKPIFIVDAAIPGDVHPSVDKLDGVFLYDLDDLERVAMQGVASRDAAAESAREIVDQEVEDYLRTVAGRAAAPALIALRSRFEEVRSELLREKRNVGAEEATRLLVNRLLHTPLKELRRLAEEGDYERAEVERLLGRLFDLPPGDSGGDSSGDSSGDSGGDGGSKD